MNTFYAMNFCRIVYIYICVCGMRVDYFVGIRNDLCGYIVRTFSESNGKTSTIKLTFDVILLGSKSFRSYNWLVIQAVGLFLSILYCITYSHFGYPEYRNNFFFFTWHFILFFFTRTALFIAYDLLQLMTKLEAKCTMIQSKIQIK